MPANAVLEVDLTLVKWHKVRGGTGAVLLVMYGSVWQAARGGSVQVREVMVVCPFGRRMPAPRTRLGAGVTGVVFACLCITLLPFYPLFVQSPPPNLHCLPHRQVEEVTDDGLVVMKLLHTDDDQYKKPNEGAKVGRTSRTSPPVDIQPVPRA